jgi:hypothetical protein
MFRPSWLEMSTLSTTEPSGSVARSVARSLSSPSTLRATTLFRAAKNSIPELRLSMAIGLPSIDRLTGT